VPDIADLRARAAFFAETPGGQYAEFRAFARDVVRLCDALETSGNADAPEMKA